MLHSLNSIEVKTIYEKHKAFRGMPSFSVVNIMLLQTASHQSRGNFTVKYTIQFIPAESALEYLPVIASPAHAYMIYWERVTFLRLMTPLYDRRALLAHQALTLHPGMCTLQDLPAAFVRYFLALQAVSVRIRRYEWRA
mmetsp:Transcript_22683/g.33150  ORF Transcript_22683/g.33150 Transcript_22683/m.33150 type:complete len:139 (+) Transcript_22683:35-451(+)